MNILLDSVFFMYVLCENKDERSYINFLTEFPITCLDVNFSLKFLKLSSDIFTYVYDLIDESLKLLLKKTLLGKKLKCMFVQLEILLNIESSLKIELSIAIGSLFTYDMFEKLCVPTHTCVSRGGIDWSFVDPASSHSHMLISKIKPYMCQCKPSRIVKPRNLSKSVMVR